MNGKNHNMRVCLIEELDMTEHYAGFDLDQTGEDWEFEVTSSYQVASELNSLSHRAFQPASR